MLSKINRLTKKDGLEDICKGGKGIRKGSFLVKSRENHLGITRVAFVVSKKITPKAHDRNLLKRRLRNATRNVLSSFPVGKDLVIFALKGIEEYSYEDIKNRLGAIFNK